jgi:Zn-dependent protease
MWPRVVELMLGAWLAISPFVFRGTLDVERYTWSLVVSGAVVIIASLLSFWPPASQARFATLLAALWLAGHGYFAAVRPGPPAAQNEITIGLLLLLFAILPNETNRPPVPWRERTTPQ